MLKLQLPRPAGKQPAAAQPQPERPQVPLLETDPAKGLTAEQAAQRMAAGLDNHAAASPTRSETEIIRDNIFTFSIWFLSCWRFAWHWWGPLRT